MGDVFEAFQMGEAKVGDAGVREVEAFKRGDLADAGEVAVGDPRTGEIEGDDGALSVCLRGAADFLDPVHGREGGGEE